MLLTKKSPLTGQENTLELPITEEEYDMWINSNVSIQNAFPTLTPDQREFMKTGYTAEDWAFIFKDDIEADAEENMGDDTP